MPRGTLFFGNSWYLYLHNNEGFKGSESSLGFYSISWLLLSHVCVEKSCSSISLCNQPLCSPVLQPDKDRELQQQKINMTRSMYETAKEDFEVCLSVFFDCFVSFKRFYLFGNERLVAKLISPQFLMFYFVSCQTPGSCPLYFQKIWKTLKQFVWTVVRICLYITVVRICLCITVVRICFCITFVRICFCITAITVVRMNMSLYNKF